MNKFTCVIIDDDPACIENLKQDIALMPDLNLIKTYTDPLLCLSEMANSTPVDLMLLDVEMPGISGVELAKELRQKTNKLIFVTGHPQYGYDAFELNANGYLLKPYSLAKFANTVNTVLTDAQLLKKKFDDEAFFYVKNKEDKGKLLKVKYSEVIVVVSEHNNVIIYAGEKKVKAGMSLSEMMSALALHSGFAQYHRSYIVNTDQICQIDGYNITMSNGLAITVGANYRKGFAQYLSERMLKANGKMK